MFFATRDLRAARGRFALITAVVLLVALLVSFLSGLTAGLKHQNVSAITGLSADRIVFADDGAGASYDESILSAKQVASWRAHAAQVTELGIGRGKAGTDDAALKSVALFGADGPAAPRVTRGDVVVSQAAADQLGVGAGDALQVGAHRYSVASVGGDDWYAHQPVVWLALPDWQLENPRGGEATVLAVSGVDNESGANAQAHTVTATVSGSLPAIASYNAENTSLSLMTYMLFAISALVIGAFFTVWTLSRIPDIATLKALGATTSSLVRDSLGQAAIVLGVGVGAGLALTVGFGLAARGSMPFVIDASTTLFPAAAMIALGMLGAAFALRFLVTTDPMTALGGAR